MNEQPAPPQRKPGWKDALAVGLATAGAFSAIDGALVFFTSQAGQGGSVWPLPGLVLLDWAAFGALAWVGVQMAIWRSQPRGLELAWLAAGALLPLVALGAWSIGPLVGIGFLLLLAAGLLTQWSRPAPGLRLVAALLVGAVGNLLFLLALIGLERLLRP